MSPHRKLHVSITSYMRIYHELRISSAAPVAVGNLLAPAAHVDGLEGRATVVALAQGLRRRSCGVPEGGVPEGGVPRRKMITSCTVAS